MKKQVLEILQKQHGFYVNHYLKTLDNEFLHKTRALWEVIEQVEQLPDDDWIEVCEQMPGEHMEKEIIQMLHGERENYKYQSEMVIVTVKHLKDDKEETAIDFTDRGSWQMTPDSEYKVIAWKPFPEPFRKE